MTEENKNIKANELRLGNWVINKHNEITQVFNLNDNGMRIHHKNTVCIDCSPIPLTPEILEKCGFKYCKQFDTVTKKPAVTYFLTHENISISFVYRLTVIHDANKNTEAAQVILKNETEYLHQLQNLYYALTGEELEVKL